MKEGIQENTIEAFKEALKEGADGVELDVRLSGKGEVIIRHDPLGSSYKHNDYCRIRAAPTLDEVFKVLPRNALLDIDLKETEAIDKVLKIVKRYAARERVLLSAPSIKSLKKVRMLDPQILVSYSPNSLSSLNLIPILREEFKLFAVSFPMEALLFMNIDAIRNYLRMIKIYDLKIILWTLQEPLFFWNHPLLQLRDYLDIIITGDPERMINYLVGTKAIRNPYTETFFRR